MSDLDDTLDEWRLWMDAQGLSLRTIHDRTAVVRRLMDYTGTTPAALTPHDIVRFMARPGITAVSRSTYHANIRAFTEWMHRTGIRDDNPADKTPRPRRPKSMTGPISQAQLGLLLATANRRRTRDYIMLGAYAGLRVHEIAKVRGEDINPTAGTLTVTGKGGKTAVLPLHHKLEPLVERMPESGWWFPSYGGSVPHVGRAGVGEAIHKCMRRAGIPATPHALRHFYGTELVRAGVNLRVVQMLMRHESPATTAIYTQVDPGMMRAGIDLLGAA